MTPTSTPATPSRLVSKLCLVGESAVHPSPPANRYATTTATTSTRPLPGVAAAELDDQTPGAVFQLFAKVSVPLLPGSRCYPLFPGEAESPSERTNGPLWQLHSHSACSCTLSLLSPPDRYQYPPPILTSRRPHALQPSPNLAHHPPAPRHRGVEAPHPDHHGGGLVRCLLSPAGRPATARGASRRPGLCGLPARRRWRWHRRGSFREQQQHREQCPSQRIHLGFIPSPLDQLLAPPLDGPRRRIDVLLHRRP